MKDKQSMAYLRALAEGLELPLDYWLGQSPDALRLVGESIASQAKQALHAEAESLNTASKAKAAVRGPG